MVGQRVRSPPPGVSPNTLRVPRRVLRFPGLFEAGLGEERTRGLGRASPARRPCGRKVKIFTEMSISILSTPIQLENLTIHVGGDEDYSLHLYMLYMQLFRSGQFLSCHKPYTITHRANPAGSPRHRTMDCHGPTDPVRTRRTRKAPPETRNGVPTVVEPSHLVKRRRVRRGPRRSGEMVRPLCRSVGPKRRRRYERGSWPNYERSNVRY